jgi:ribonuclease HI
MDKRETPPLNHDVLFTDASVNSQLKRGVGGYLLLSAASLEAGPAGIDKPDVIKHLVTRRFTDAGSTQLEIQTMIWALEDYRKTSISARPGELTVYTDSQCAAGLLRRRSGLENKNYIGSKTNSVIKNASLYQTFYSLHDELGITVLKVAGHGPSSSHDTVHRIFSILDREVRKALRSWMDELKRGA